MAVNYQVAQYRYYNSSNNTGGYENWLTNLFGSGRSIKKLGIQSLPGIVFNISGIGDGIIINHTGIYEIDLRNTTTSINSLAFTGESLRRIEEVSNASIIVDVLYSSEG